MRVLLVQTPFLRLTAPSISLAMLQAALGRAAIDCDLEYLNLDFARRIGTERYTWLAVASPPYLLAGDLVFAPALNEKPIGREKVATLVAGLGPRAEGGVPEWFVPDFEELASLADDYLVEQVRRFDWSRYDLVGLSTAFNVTPALALARRIKQLPGSPRVVLGGCHCDGEMGEHLHRSYPFLDFVCRGEGERFIVDLACRLRDKTPAEDAIAGLVWRRDGKTIADARRASGTAASGTAASGTLAIDAPGPGFTRDGDIVTLHKATTWLGASREFALDDLPVPDYAGWLKQVRQTGAFADCELQLPIETSRGCWYGERRNCLFCGLNGDGIAYRRKSARRILEDLRSVMGLGVKVFHLVDNILDPAYFEDVLPAIAELNDGYEFFWPVRPALTREQMALLRGSGVYWIQVGIESLSTPVLRLMRKGTTALQNVRLLRDAAEIGLGTSWNVLYGFAGEDPHDYRRMAALMPALSHLQPPRMSYQIRMDRFSPLFNERAGVKDVVPAPAYADVFQLAPEVLEQLAYYFEYSYMDGRDPLAYATECLDEMARWRHEVGRAALISFDSGSATCVRDSRSVAIERHAALRGVERAVLEAAGDGIDDAALASRIGRPPGDIDAALRRLIERRWVVSLDGRYLSLVVPVDAWVPAGVPPVMVGESLERLYCQRMRLLSEASSGLRRPTAQAAQASDAVSCDEACR